MDNEHDRFKVLVETRGERGYVVVAPSNGRVHPSGGAYRLLAGGVEHIATITPEERAELHKLARSLDTIPKDPPRDAPTSPADGTAPGSDYNARGDVLTVLETHEWVNVYWRDGTSYLRRPGKSNGISATFGHADTRYLYVFSTATVFEAERAYSPFAVYAVLEHGGDYSAAARALRQQGYGAVPVNGQRDETVQPPLAETLTAVTPVLPAPSNGGASGQVRFMTAREFASQTPAVTEYVVEPWIPVGGITKIDGAPKRAGKTTLITYIVAAVLNGTDFLGQPTKQGPVVLLTEQGSTSFRESLARAGLLDRDDLHLAIFRDFAGLDWPDVVAQAFAKAVKVGAVLLVVDTLPACAGVRGDEENSAGRALEVMEPIQVGADTYGIGVAMSFHDRKDGGEVGESGRGSNAYAGAVDIVLRVTKPGGNLKPSIRKIEALSRFEATPAELYIELTDAGYVSLGSEADVVSAAVARALTDILPTSGDTAMPIESKSQDGEVVERGLRDLLTDQGVKAARSTLDAEVERWQKAGYVGRTGDGKRGKPYRYWLVAKPPGDFVSPTRPGASEERNDAQGQLQDSFATAKGEMVSSDARLSSEESNRAQTDADDADSFHSSDAPDGYSGRDDGIARASGLTWERL